MENEIELGNTKYYKNSSFYLKKNKSVNNRTISIKKFKQNLLDKEIQSKNIKIDSNSQIKNINHPSSTSTSFFPKNSNTLNLLNITKNTFNESSNLTRSYFFNYDENKEKDIPVLLNYYHNSNIKLNSDYNLSKSEKKDFFNKYKISSHLSEKETLEIESIVSANLIKTQTKPKASSHYEYFKNPLDSAKFLKLNKNICENINNIFNEKQTKKYIDNFDNARCFLHKVNSMPRIKIDISELNVAKKEKNIIQSMIQPIHNFHEQNEDDEEMSLKDNKLEFNSVEFHGSLYFNQNNKPKARTLFSMTYDEFDCKLFIFGGILTEKFNDLWCIDLRECNKWTNLEPKGESPAPRFGHTLVRFKNQLIIFGGKFNYDPSLLKEVLFYDIISNSFFNVNTTNSSIIRWRRHHIAEVLNPYMLIYGGIDEEGNVLNDICMLDLIFYKWHKYDFKTIQITNLAHHCSTTVVKSENKNHPSFNIFKFPDLNPKQMTGKPIKYEGIYLFGGYDQNKKFTNDLRIIRIGKKPLEWIVPKTEGTPPCPRISSSITFFEELHTLVVFGGRNERDSCMNDIYIISLINFKWTKIVIYDYLPRNRAEHCAICFNNMKLIVFGGINNQKYLGSDFYVVDLEKFERKHIFNKNDEKSTKQAEKTVVDLNSTIIPRRTKVNLTINKKLTSLSKSKSEIFTANLLL